MSSKNTNQVNIDLIKLNETIQIKRTKLNKLYDDINTKTAPLNLIKNVNFDENEESDTETKLTKTSPVKKKLIVKVNTNTTQVGPNVSKMKINTKLLTTKLNNQKKQKLQDLKQKVITRKYAYLWLRKHNHSSLLPSQSIKHHLKKQLSIYFHTWKQQSRFIRNEWRLTVKSQCHYNYTLLNKFWLEWQVFTKEHKHSSQQEKKAHNHYHSKLAQFYLNELKLNRLNQLKKKHRLQQIIEQLDSSLIQETFQKWLFKLKQSQQLHYLDQKAQLHFQQIEQTKYFQIWYYKLKHEKEERQQMLAAKRNYKLNLLKKCWQSLQYYARYRRRKTIQKAKLKEYAESQLVYRVYKTWLERLDYKLKLNDLNDMIKQFQMKQQLKRVFHLWHENYMHKCNLKERYKQMRKYYEKKLKMKYFTILHENYTIVLNERIDEIKAEKFYVYWQKKLIYFKWTDRLEDKNDIKLMHLYYKSKCYYEKRISNKLFKAWKIFRLKQLELNAKISKATRFYETNLKIKYFKVFDLYVDCTKRKRENHLKAYDVFKFKTLNKFLSVWFQKYEISINFQMNNRIAILHYDSKSKTNIFNKWIIKYRRIQLDTKQSQMALNYYSKLITKQMFHNWHSQIIELKQIQLNETRAIQHDFKRLCQPCLNEWKLELITSKKIKLKQLNAIKHYESKLISHLFNLWFKQTKVFKAQNSLIQLKYNQALNAKKVEYFQEWLEQARQSRQDRLNNQLAIAFNLKQILLKYLNNWLNYTEYKSIKRYQLEQAKKNMQKLKTKLIFSKWKLKTIDSMSEQTKYELATRFHLNKLTKKLFLKWHIDYIRTRREINLKSKQADWFLQMRFKTEFYYKWRLKYEHEVKLKTRNSKALLFWSINVQRQHLKAWFKWYQLEKLKKQRYKLALEQRQHDILKECARKFLIFALDSRQRRLVASKQVNNLSSIYKLDLMNKYFTIWFNKCNLMKFKQKNKHEIHIIINESSSKEKQMMIENTLCVVSPTMRPTPRRPAFILNDSIQISNEVVIASNKKSTIIDPSLLMPPSAFLSLHSQPKVIIQEKEEDDEIKNLELIKFKKLIENYSIKSDRLKRLKEQEKLLNNCFVNANANNNNNNTSIYENLKNEKEEISQEIKQLIDYLKSERLLINQLSKQFNLF